MENFNEIKCGLKEQFEKALDSIFTEGFGKIEIIIDKERGIFDVIPSPRIRIKVKS